MATVNIVENKFKVKYSDIIKLQLIIYCFKNNINLSENEINCLIVLCAYKKYNLSEFCDLITRKGIFKTSQTVRNFLSKAQELGIVIKEGTSKKEVMINPSIDIKIGSNILLKYQFLYVSEK